MAHLALIKKRMFYSARIILKHAEHVLGSVWEEQMAKDDDIDSGASGIHELVERLVPGTRLTLIFRSALGEECRRHRIVEFADGNIVRLATVLPEKEPFVEIVFAPGDRIFWLRDGFVLVSEDGIGGWYFWDHV
jgi:hypothetical protein